MFKTILSFIFLLSIEVRAGASIPVIILASGMAQNVDAKSNCPDVGVDQDILESYPAYNQFDYGTRGIFDDYDMSICYAVTSATMYDLTMARSSSDIRAHVTSPVSLAFKMSRNMLANHPRDIQGGWVEESEFELQAHGSCDLREYADDNGDLILMAQTIGRLHLLHKSYINGLDPRGEMDRDLFRKSREAIIDEVVLILRRMNPSRDIMGSPFEVGIYDIPGRDQVCSSDFFPREEVQDLASHQQRVMIKRALERRNSYIFIDEILDAACLGSTEGVPVTYGVKQKKFEFSERAEKIRILNQVLSKGRPVGAAMDYDVFTSTSEITPKRVSGHAATIVGQRWNSEKERCDVMVKDSYGSDCGNLGVWECQNGIHIMDREVLFSGTDELYIPTK